MKRIIYGEGGYDPSKPNNNVIDEIEVLDDQVEQPTYSITESALTDLQASLESAQTVSDIKDTLNDFVQAIKG